MKNLVALGYKKRKLILALIALAIILRFIFLNLYNWQHGNTGYSGVQYLVDSFRYIEGAEALLDGGSLDYKQQQFAGYIALIVFAKITGAGVYIVVWLQILMALLSAYFLYKLVLSFSGSRFAGFTASGFYLANPFITQWHLYIMTESLYTSMLIITVFLLYKALEKKTIRTYISAIISLLIILSIRPNAWVLLPLTLTFVIRSYLKRAWIKSLVSMFVTTLFVVIVTHLPFTNKAIENIGTEHIRMNQVFLNGEVIPNCPELRVNMPVDNALAGDNWKKSYLYILQNPLPCIKLAIKRVVTELLQINRSWLSVKYKLRLYLWLFPAYIFALIGGWYFRKNKAVKIIFWVVIMHLMIIALTFADYEGRFLNYFLPLIYACTGCGVAIVINKILKKQQSTG
jgi:hypothetical protein